MNWLAHTFLSKDSIDYQLGNILADPFKGKVWPGASHNFALGIEMHKCIDAFTDSHPVVLRSKSRLGKKGYLKGVIVDITYDYMLVKYWEQYSSVDFNDYLDKFYSRAKEAVLVYPKKEAAFVMRLIESDYLRNYDSLNGLAEAFGRIDNRLSDKVLKKESANKYLPLVEAQMSHIAGDFHSFFPDLINYVMSKSNERVLNNWISAC